MKQGDQHSFGRADRGVQLPVNTKIAVATRIMKAEPVSQQGHGDVVRGTVGKTDVGSISEGLERRDFVSAQSLVKSEEGENAPKRMRIHSGELMPYS